jgi:predicted hotdog family 3-hydroxylacyl-ACP dehydratase
LKPEYSIDEVVPHSGIMSLLSEVLDYDSDTLRASVIVSEDSLFASPRGVPAWVGVEYMAQAIAAYAGVSAREAGEGVSIGFLLGTRKYSCTQPYFPLGDRLTVAVSKELQDDNGLAVFQCIIQSESGVEALGNLNVFQPDNVEQFLANERDKG